jgi:hypothetical protein
MQGNTALPAPVLCEIGQVEHGVHLIFVQQPVYQLILLYGAADDPNPVDRAGA